MEAPWAKPRRIGTSWAVGRLLPLGQVPVEALKTTLDRITQLSQEAMSKPWDAAVRLQLADRCDEMGNAPLAEMWRKAAAGCAGPMRVQCGCLAKSPRK